MVTHTLSDILQRNFLVGDDPQRHGLFIIPLPHSVGQVAVHVGTEMIEEAPHTCLAVAAAREIRFGVSLIPREIGVLSREPPHLAGIFHHILGVEHVFLVFHIESRDTALVGMGTNGIVGNADGHPHRTLAPGPHTHHLHDPSFIGIADGESLTLGIVAISLDQVGHHADRLTSRFRPLQGDIDQRAIVEDSGRIDHLLPTAVSGLADSHLILVDIADDIISLRSLRYLAMILVGIPIIDLTHRARCMLPGRVMAEVLKHAIIIRIVGADDRAVGTGSLGHDEIGASRSMYGDARKQGQEQFSHI